MPKPYETWFIRRLLNFGLMLARAKSDKPILSLARWLINIGWVFCNQDKKTIFRNLNIAFQDSLTEADKSRIAFKTLENLAITCSELLRFNYLSPSEVSSLAVEVEGWHHLEKAREKGTGVIGLGMHFGNWEYIGYYLNLKGMQITNFALPLNDPIADEFINKLRDRFGLKIIKSNSAFLKTCALALKNNGILGLVADQYAGATGTVVPFMGTPAYTYSGPAVFHLKYKSDILPMYSVRLAPFKFKIIIEAPVEYPELTGSRIDDEKIILNAVSHRIGLVIRKHPEQWLWTHKRWKTP